MALKSIFRILLTVGAVVLVVLIALPFRSRPWTSPENACINNLRYIDEAKYLWATETHRTNGPVSWDDILPYLAKVQKEQGRKVEIPHCPKGGTYTLGNIEDLPKCSIAGHTVVP